MGNLMKEHSLILNLYTSASCVILDKWLLLSEPQLHNCEMMIIIPTSKGGYKHGA